MRPSPVQEWILLRMADGCTLDQEAVQTAVYDSRRVLRRPVEQKTFKRLVGQGWIVRDWDAETAREVKRWKITERGRAAIAPRVKGAGE